LVTTALTPLNGDMTIRIAIWRQWRQWWHNQRQHLSAVSAISHNLPFSVQYRTICRSPHNIAQFIVHRIFSHNLPFSATFCIISWLKNQLYHSNLCRKFDLGRVDTMKRGESIPWPGASWYWRHARCVTLGRVDTVTRGELIPWPGASWYHDLGRVDTGVTRGACHWGELIPWPGASWYQDLGRVDTACPEVVSRPSLWSVLVTT
jgi:hypothetical protein